jgi:hypothetical protein
MTFRVYIVLILLFLARFTASAQALPDSKLINFHYEIFDSQPIINDWIRAFRDETSIPVTVVLTYAYHLEGYHEFIKKWTQDKQSKGVLIILNPFAVNVWENYVDIIPSSTIQIAPADIDNLKKLSVFPIFEQKPWVNRETGEVSPDIFSRNQMIIEAVKQILFGLGKVAHVKDNIIRVPKPLANGDGSYTFITPSGKKIVLPAKVGNVHFFQKVGDDDTRSCVAGTLAGFRIGYDRYRAVISNGEFQGYKAGSKIFKPSTQGISNQSHSDAILGIVCTQFFQYMKFRAVESGNPESPQRTFSFYSGGSDPILTEGQFPLKAFSDQNDLVKQEAARGHEDLTMTELRGVEYAILKNRCDMSDLLPLAKLGQLALNKNAYFLNFIKVPEEFFMPLIDWSGFKRMVLGKDIDKLGDWVKRVDADPTLQQLYSKDKYKFYSLTIGEFYKFLEEQYAPPVLLEKDNFVFVTPVGTKIVLPKRVKGLKFFQKATSEDEVDIVLGTLTGFTVDDKTYTASFSDGNFGGYKNGNTIFPASPATESEHVVMGFPDSKEGIVTKGNFEYFRLVKFKASGLSLYTPGSGTVRGVADFPIQPFSPACPAVEEVRITPDQMKEQPLVVPGGEFSNIEKDIINKYKSDGGLIAAFTVCQYLNQYVALGGIFTRHFNEWGSSFVPSMYYWDDLMYRNQSLQAAWKNDKRTFYLEFLKSFKAEITRWHRVTKKEFLARLAKKNYLKIPHLEVTFALYKFMPSDYNALTKEQRIAILQLLTRQELMGGTYEAPEAIPSPVPIKFSMEGGETRALRIVETTPEKDRPYILDAIVAESEGRPDEDRRFLIHALCEDFDGPEFVTFVQTIVDWVKKHKPAPESLTLDAVVEESTKHFGMAMPFNPSVWMGSSVSKRFSPDGKVLLSSSHQVWKGETKPDRQGNELPVFETVTHSLKGKPYDYFIMEFKEELKTESKVYRKGERVRVPVLYGYLLFNDLNGKRLQAGAQLAVDVVLVVAGVGELRAGWSLATSLGKARLLFDNGLNIGGAVMNLGLEQYLEKSENPEAKAFLKAWEALSYYSDLESAYSLAEMVVSAGNRLRNSGFLTSAAHDNDVLGLMRRVEAEFNVKAGTSVPIPTMRLFGFTKVDERRFQMSEDVRKVFDEMFGQKIDHLKKFEKNIGMIDAWSIVKEDEVFRTKFLSNDKTNFTDLERIAKYLERNNGQIGALREELDVLTTVSAKGAWARGLEAFADHTGIESKLATLTDPSLRVAFRNDYSSPSWGAARDLYNSSPEYIEAWVLLRKHNAHTSNSFIFNSNTEQLAEDLRRVSSHLAYSGKKLEDITKEFDALPNYQARRDWINRLPVYSGNYPNIARKVNSLDPDVRAQFWSDFGADKDKLIQIEQKGSSADAMVDAWLIVRARTGTRTDIGTLSALADYITQRKHSDKINELALEFSKVTDKDGWLRTIPLYTKFPDLDNKLFALTAEQRIAFRTDFKGATEDRFKSFNDDLFQVDAWRLLSDHTTSRTKAADLKRVADHIRVNSNRISTLEAELRVLKDVKDERDVPLSLDTWLEGMTRTSAQAKLESKLASLRPEDRIRFRHDIGGESTVLSGPLIAAIEKNDHLLDAWQVMSDHEAGRINLKNLESVSSYIRKSGKPVTGLRDEYRSITSPSARTKWIDNLPPRWVGEEVAKLTGGRPKLNDGDLYSLVWYGKITHGFEDEDMLAFALLHHRKSWVSLEGMKLVVASVKEGKVASRGKFKPEWDFMKVYREVQRRAINKQILDPKDYLDPAFYAEHLRNFQSRGSYLLTETQYKLYIEGVDLLGRKDGLVIASPDEINRVITEAGTSVAELEKLLGFSPGWWQNKGGIYRVDIIDPPGHNLRFQNGTEEAANEFFHPGGYTSGGVKEAVTNRIPNNCSCAEIKPLDQFGGVYYTALETKLAKVAERLGKQGNAVRTQFDAEFRSSAVHLEAFNKNPVMVEAWLAVKDIDAKLKGDVKALTAIADYIKDNGLRIEGIKAELQAIAHAGDYEKSEWLSGLTAFSAYGQLEGHMSTLDASLRVAIRKDLKHSPLKNVLADLQKAVAEDVKLFDPW